MLKYSEMDFSKYTGLILAILAPLVYSLVIAPQFIKPALSPALYALIGFAFYWILAGYLFADTPGNKNSYPWKFRISRRMIYLAIMIGIALSLLVPLFTQIAEQFLPAADSGGILDTTAQYSPWIILLGVVTAGVTEEFIFRAYIIERLQTLSVSTWICAVISIVTFVLAHMSGWNLTHILGVVLPMAVILTILYLWKRNVTFVIIIHTIIDLPLFFITIGN